MKIYHALIVMFLLAATPAFAYTKGNLESILAYEIAKPFKLSDGTAIQYTPNCFVDCYLPIKISYAGTLESSTKSLASSDISFFSQKIVGKDNLKNIETFYVANESYDYEYDVCDKSQNTTAPNPIKWYMNCTQSHKEKVKEYRTVLKPLSSLTMEKGKEYVLVIKGKMGIGKGSVDIVPSVFSKSMVEMAWWNASSLKMKPVYLWVSTGTTAANYQALINVTYDADMQADFDDLRFIALDNTTVLDYWIEKKTDSSFADIWVESATALDSVNNVTVFMYYGNSGMTAYSNIKTTMVFGDDFDDATIDTALWSCGGATETGGMLQMTSSNGGCVGKTTLNPALYWLEIIARNENTADSSIFGWVNTTNSTNNAWFAVQHFVIQSAGAVYATNTRGASSNTQNYPLGTATTADVRWKYRLTDSTAWYYKNGTSTWNITTNLSANFLVPYVGTDSSVLGFYDYIFARKFHPVEASSAYGAEESPPSAGNNSTSIALTINGGVGAITHAYTTSADNITAIVNVTGLPVNITVNGTVVVSGTTSATVQYVFPAGYWNVTGYTVGNSTHASSSTTIYANITKAVQNLVLESNATWTASYPTTINITGSGCGLTCILYRNGSARSNPDIGLFAASSYNYTYNSSGNANYSANTTTYLLAISKGVTDMTNRDVVPNYNATYPTYPTASRAYCYASNTEVPIVFYRNGTDISAQNNVSSTLGAGVYSYWCNATATENYTANFSIMGYEIQKGTPAIAVAFNTSASVSEGTSVNISCTYPAEIVSAMKLYNDTAQQAALSVDYNTTGKIGVWNYTCNSTATANYTAGSDTDTLSVVATGSLTVRAYNEANLSQQLTFDIQVYNSSYSTSSTGQTVYTNNIVKGNLTVVVSASGYSTRYYYISVPVLGTASLNTYLINSTISNDITFTIRGYYGQLLDDVSLNITRLIPTEIAVAQGISDSAGTFTMTLDPSANYRIYLVKTGFNSKNISLIPTLDAYTIYMTSGIVSIPEYWGYYSRFTKSCAFNNTTRTLNVTWADGSAALDYVNISVISRSTSGVEALICSNSSAAASGSIYCSFGVAANKSFLWTATATFDGLPMPFCGDSWSDRIADVALGDTGLIAAFLIILFAGFIGVQLYNPIATVLLTTFGVGASVALGVLSIGTGTITLLIGLLISAAVLIYKMRD